MEKPIEVHFFDDPTNGATLKTKNDPSDPYQRSVVTSYRGRPSSYKALVTLRTCVHGYLDSNDQPRLPATLVALEIQLNSLDHDSQYKSMYAELKFSNMTFTSFMNEPQVIAYSPFETPVRARETTERVTKTSQEKITSVEGGAVGIRGTVGFDIGRTKTTIGENRHFQLLQASREMSTDMGSGPNVVWWHMMASTDSGRGPEGIPPILNVTALVQRKDMAKFQADFKLRLQAGAWHDSVRAFLTFWGIGRDEPILFDPSRSPVGGTGINPENLKNLVTDGILGKIGFAKNPTHDTEI